MRHEQGCETFLEERVERPERLRRRARLELDELGRVLEAEQRIRESVRRRSARVLPGINLAAKSSEASTRSFPRSTTSEILSPA